MKNEEEFVEVPPEYMDRVIGNYNPVVIITTINDRGQGNAAPFAMCMEVCHKPPLFAFSVGEGKDTCRNVRETGEFVINVAGEEILSKLMITAGRFPPEINEMVKAGFQELPGKKVRASRIGECGLHFECRVVWVKEAGDHLLILGEVVAADVNKDIITEDFNVLLERIKPVHYLGRGTDAFLQVGNYIRMPSR